MGDTQLFLCAQFNSVFDNLGNSYLLEQFCTPFVESNPLSTKMGVSLPFPKNTTGQVNLEGY